MKEGRICTDDRGSRNGREDKKKKRVIEWQGRREREIESARRKSTGVKERARATVTPTPATKLGSTFWRTCTHHTLPPCPARDHRPRPPVCIIGTFRLVATDVERLTAGAKGGLSSAVSTLRRFWLLDCST